MSVVIADAERRLADGGKNRILLWRTSLKTAIYDEDFLDENAADLVALVAETFHLYRDQDSQRAVVAFLKEAIKSATFMKTFAATLLKLSSAPKLPPHQAFTLIVWSSLTLEQLDTTAMKKAVLKLIELQASMLTIVSSSSACPWHFASRVVCSLLKSKKELVAEYLELAKTSGSPSLVRVLLDAGRRDSGAASACRNELIEVYCDKFLGAKERPSAEALAATSLLVKDISHAEMAEKVMPAAMRILRRVPEVAMAVLASFFASTQLDMDPYCAELTPLILQQLRTKDALRALAIETLQGLAKKLKTAETLATLVRSITGLLEGKVEGKIKMPAERSALLTALSTLPTAPGQDGGHPELAVEVCSSLSALYKDEINEDVRINLLSCLGLWLANCAAPVDAATALLIAGIKDTKDALRRAHLRCAIQVFKSAAEELKAALAPLAELCSKVVTDALLKPGALRLEGTLGFLCAAHAASASDAAASVLEKLLPIAVKADSPLLSASGSAKMAPSDCVSAAEMCEVLLVSHAVRLGKTAGAVESVGRLLTSLLLHFSREVRKAAEVSAARVGSSSPALMQLTARSLRHWMDNATLLAALVGPEAAADETLSSTQLASRFSAALFACTSSPPESMTAAQLGELLLASHHPVITAPLKHSTAVWVSVSKRVPGMSKLVQGCAEELCVLLAGEGGLRSVRKSDQCAAQQSVRSVMTMAATAFFPHLQTALSTILDRAEYEAITPDDMEVFHTSEGMLSSERIPEGTYVPEVVVNKNVKKAKGRMRTDNRAFGEDDDDSDDEPTPAVAVLRPSQVAAAAGRGAGRGPGGQKTGPKDASVRQAEARMAKLVEESALRVSIRKLKERLEVGLVCLNAAASGNIMFTAAHLEEFQELCMPFLPSEIAGAAAFDAVRALACCLPGRLGSKSLAVAASLRLVVMATRSHDASAYAELPKNASVAEVVTAMSTVTREHKQMQFSAYRFLFPVLQALLKSSVHTPMHESALGVLALHCGAGDDIPRPQSLDLLYSLLGVVPAYKERVQPLLKTLCAGCNDTELLAAAGGLLSPSHHVRAAALAALPHAPTIAEGIAPSDPQLNALLFMACHDVNEANVEAAVKLWEMAPFFLPESFVDALVMQAGSPHPEIRAQAAAALSAALGEHPAGVGNAFAAIFASYMDGALAVRLGCATALKHCCPQMGDSEVPLALDFLIRNGLADGNDKVREQMVSAGMSIVDVHGAVHAPSMLPVFEGFLSKKESSLTPDQASRYDLVREGVVVFLGTLARHLPPTDPKRLTIIETLISVLGTPSEAVQRAVSTCMPPLMQPLATDREYLEALVSRLMKQLTQGVTYGERRGAAFGISGLVKGLGIMAMKNYGIMDSLKRFVEDKKDGSAREGALLAFECLSDRLGKLFEPYIIYILPLLLACFGDIMPQVRQATEDASRMIMGQLTASGVKLVLPTLLKGLEDKVWRTKQGSVQLLGAMAYCAPKQLGTCLPTIVPRLSEVLSDPHPKVQAAAQEALNEIGSVIRNPEVQKLVPFLLLAISDPSAHTKTCLDVLLETVFVNTIDAPSLALILPVVHRGLRDRTGETKKRASRIVGNMCSLINDPKDMTPYVPTLMPELMKSLVDPLPEVRAVSARAMGSLLKGMGTDAFSDLVPWLMETLKSEGSSVERSGAAQGLAEVLAVLGTGHMEELLPDILQGCKHRNNSVREGHLTLFQFLPITLEAQFQPYLQRVLPAILDGLADEQEGVRDAALGAGRIFVDHYSKTALELLLPAVEEGIFNENWRIRQSSVLLMGKLLFKVAGTTGNIVVDGGSDDEGAAEENYAEAIIASLGMQRRNDVLARLYIIRSDPQYSVRTEALHVWKTVVVNTPKTLSQILHILMEQVIALLASEDCEDSRITAARCLGELCRKMGERVLGRIIPILQDGMNNPVASIRQGVCLGLKEVLENISRGQLQEHLADVLPAVQSALCDTDADVREAAGEAFGILFKGGPGSAVDSVVPSMIAGLTSDDSFQESLDGLLVILGVRPQVFQFTVPKLLKAPLSANNLRALGALAAVSGHTLHHHLGAIVNALLPLASQAGSGAAEDAAKETLACVALAVEEEGLHVLVGEVLKALEDPIKRRGAAEMLGTFASKCPLDFQEHITAMIDSVIVLMGEEDPEVLMSLWKAMEAIAGSIPKEDQPKHVRCVKEAVLTAREKERRKRKTGPYLVAGFCLPKAMAPLLPIYLQGVLQGSSTEVREMAAEALGELVDVSSEEALKPFVVQITGPLIRIIGDRFPSQVKAAILMTLGMLISKAGPGLKPFVPQLQTSFLKCLLDPAENVRMRAATNLGELTHMSARVDQLATDLAASAKSAEPQIRDSYLFALKGLLLASGSRVSPAVLCSVGDTLRELMKGTGDDEAFRWALAQCVGAHASCADFPQLQSTLQAGPFTKVAAVPTDRQLHAALLATVAQHAGTRLEEGGMLQPFVEAIQRYSRDEDVYVKVAAGRAASRLAIVVPAALSGSVDVLVALLGPGQSSEVQRQALLSVRRMALSGAVPLDAHLKDLVQSMCSVHGSTSGPTKQVCERTMQKVLRLEVNLEVAQKLLAEGPGGLVKSILTDAFLRRLQKLADDDEYFATEEY